MRGCGESSHMTVLSIKPFHFFDDVLFFFVVDSDAKLIEINQIFGINDKKDDAQVKETRLRLVD